MIAPDFNRDRFEGQMNPEERALLYHVVMETKARSVWEVGTCRGGGTTYYIACALENLAADGLLYTSENFREFYDYAQALYADGAPLGMLRHRVNFNFGSALEVFPALLADPAVPLPDVVVIDGGPSSMEALWQFAMFRPYMRLGTCVCFHDWDNEKTNYIRPVIGNEHDWELVNLEIAFAVFQRRSDVHRTYAPGRGYVCGKG